MKKVKIILLSFGLFVVLAYIFREPEWPEQQAILSQLPNPSSIQVIDIDTAFSEKPWDRELQEKFLSKVEGKEKLPKFMVNGYDARKNSRLLVQNPITIGSGWMNDWFKMRYWECTGTNFRLLGVYMVDLEKKEIVKVKED